MKPTFRTERLDVFQLNCERTLKGAVSRDVFVAFFNKDDGSNVTWRPVAQCTISPDVINPGLHQIEWVEVDTRHRRSGVATELILAIQNSVGPLRFDHAEIDDEDNRRAEPARRFTEAVGGMLTGFVHVYSDSWLDQQGYDAEQRKAIHKAMGKDVNKYGLMRDRGHILERFERNPAARHDGLADGA